MIWARVEKTLRKWPGLNLLGHRGAILLVLAVIDLAYGLSLVTPSHEAVSADSIIWRQHYAPTWVWGIGWISVAVVLAVYAFRHNDAVGYAAAIGWKVAWGATTFASWAFGGVERGWLAAIIWLVFAGMVVIISDWPEPPEQTTLAVIDHITEATGELPGGDVPGGATGEEPS